MAWNSEVGKLVGWFYECASATDPMPMRGRYVDIDRCLYAPVDDVHEMHEEYLVKQEAKTCQDAAVGLRNLTFFEFEYRI